jgi:DCN1-like protein 1/2
MHQWSQRRSEELFEKYAGAGESVIGPCQIERLCGDLQVAPEDLAVLGLSFAMGAAAMGYYSRPEWLLGMERLCADSVSQLRSSLRTFRQRIADSPTLPASVSAASAVPGTAAAAAAAAPVPTQVDSTPDWWGPRDSLFKEVYRFAFVWAKEGEAKVIDLQTADGLLALLLEDRSPLTAPFRLFLKESTYKGVNLDQWMNFLEFSQVVEKDFTGYREDGAWPVILDEFVLWAVSNKLASPQVLQPQPHAS